MDWSHSITVMNFYCLIIISKIFNNIVLHLISFIFLFSSPLSTLILSLSLSTMKKSCIGHFRDYFFVDGNLFERFIDNLSDCQEIHLSTVSLKKHTPTTSLSLSCSFVLLYCFLFLTYGVQFNIQYTTDYLSIITNPMWMRYSEGDWMKRNFRTDINVLGGMHAMKSDQNTFMHGLVILVYYTWGQ